MRIDTNVPQYLYEDKRVMENQFVKKTAEQQQAAQQERPLSPEEVENTVQQLNSAIEAFNLSFRLTLHEGSERYMMQVVDLRYNEVIKEIPPKKLLDLAANIKEMIGLLLDEKK